MARIQVVVLLVLLSAGCVRASQPEPTPQAPTSTAAAKPTVQPTSTPAVAAKPTAAPTRTAAPQKQATAPVASPRIASATLAMGERDDEPINPTTEFRQGATEFYVVGRVQDAGDSRLEVTWRPIDAPTYQGNNPIRSSTLRVSASQRFWSSLFREESLPPGRYAVDLAFNQAAPHRVEFTVLPSLWPVVARPEKDLPTTQGQAKPTTLQPTNLQFIVDASGSMTEPVGGMSKMEAAREALHSLVSALPTDPGVNVGLRAYGHRSGGADKARSCQDTQLLVPMQAVDRAQLREQIDAIAAVGEYTPMALAIRSAMADFTAGDRQNAVVLVSDGKETCESEPASLIRSATEPLHLKVHVVGFDVADDADARAQLQSIASATGGVYVDAQTPDELAEALKKLAAEQAKVVRVQEAPGQLRLQQVPGTTVERFRIYDRGGKQVVQEFGPKRENYQLPAGTYVAQWQPFNSGVGSMFRIEIGGNQESPLRLGGMELITRTQPDSIAILDQAANRRIGVAYSFPKQPISLPPGRYTVLVKQTSAGEWSAAQRDVEVQPNTIVQVEI